MSNPLLRPDDPRFQKPDVHDPEGKNRFGEAGGQEASATDGGDPYALGSEESRPFVPQFEVQQQSRPEILFVLGGVGWAAAVVGAVSLTGVLDVGWISPLLGVVPAGAAWFLAHEELKAIQAGAIQAESQEKSRHAYWMGLSALVACAAIVAAMIYRGLRFLPDI